jgi:tripartite motif-containing protein 71
MKLQKFSLILTLMLIIGLVPFTAFASASTISLNAVSASSIHPGDSVTISGTSSYSDVIVKAVRPSGSVVFYDIAKVTNSQFSTSFRLGSNEEAGTYKVIAGQMNDVDTKDLVVEAAATGCNCGGGGGSPGAITGTITGTTDGNLALPAGKAGEVSLQDEVTISVPANATDKDMQLTIKKLVDTTNLLTGQDVLASPIYEILKNFSENFNKPVSLTFAFDPTKLSGTQKASVYYYDEVKKSWVEVGGQINENHITVEVNHFTKYAVFASSPAAVAPVNPTINFSDISGHWAEANIKQAVIDGIVSGYPDGTFKPEKTVTRAEFAVMLMKTLKTQGEGSALTFTDKAKIGAWAQKAVAQAIQAGIIKGFADGTFRPNAVITRVEIATMLAKASGKTIESNTATDFADDKDIPAWAKTSVNYVKQAGIVKGKGNNQFAPKDQATRAEAVTVLLNMLAQESK